MRHLLPCLCLLLLAACSRSTPDPIPQDNDVPRIASMSPALTAMLVELGAGHRIVGRSGFCTAVDPSVPVVGDLLSIHWEHLARVGPTHVLVQAAPGMVDPALVDLAARRGWTLHTFPLVTATDIQDTMASLPAAVGLDELEAGFARKRAEAFQDRIDGLYARGPVLHGERILLLSATEPPLAWGGDTYLGEVIEKLGALNALEIDGWASIGFEDVVRSNADRIVIVGVVAPPETHPIFTAMSRIPGDVRVDLLVHPELDLPATQLPELIASMRTLLDSEHLQ